MDMLMNPTRTFIRPLLRSAMLVAALGLAGTATAQVEARKEPPTNRGLESRNQPVVQRTDFVFDAMPDGYNGLSGEEQRRLLEWFDGIDLGYGDRVALANSAKYGRSRISNAVADLLGQYGLLLADGAPSTAGEATAGAVRIVVTRYTASVPGCPNWSHRAEVDLQGGLSSDYGCAINGNLAAMIANPEDLIRGRRSRSDLEGAISSRAIKAYRDAAPSGAGGGLK
jgi:pilus assembly protein CpaD